MDNDLIGRDLERAEAGELDTREEQRGAFTRPVVRPMAGPTIIERLSARFGVRPSERKESARSQTRS